MKKFIAWKTIVKTYLDWWVKSIWIKTTSQIYLTLKALLLCYIPCSDHLSNRKGCSSSRVHSPGQPVYGGIKLFNIYIYLDSKDKSRRDCIKKQKLTWKKITKDSILFSKIRYSQIRMLISSINILCSYSFFHPILQLNKNWLPCI